MRPLPDAEIIRVYGESITIAWDSSVPVGRGPGRIAAYGIYYQELSTSQWFYLGEIPATGDLRYRVTHEQVGDGLFAFGVRSITADRSYSAMHSSLDWNAKPLAGWYVWWVKKE
jgi:hypothetical protein